jgi:hypothetical protein
MSSEYWRRKAQLLEFSLRLAIEQYLELERLARAAAERIYANGSGYEEFDALLDYFAPLTDKSGSVTGGKNAGLDENDTHRFNG